MHWVANHKKRSEIFSKFKMPESIIDQYCEVSTFAGVVDWHFSKNAIGKVFWLTMIAIAMGITIFQVHETCQDYWNDGIGTFKSTFQNEQMDDDFTFPSVTVCNFNRVMKSKLIESGIDQKVFEYAFGAVPISYDLSLRTFGDIESWRPHMEVYEQLWSNYSKTYYNGKQPDVNKMIKEYGHDCDFTVLRLAFSGFEGDRVDNCKKRVKEVMTTYGKCFLIDLKKVQSRPGPGGGLQLLLNAAPYEYPDDMVMNNYLEKGLILSIGYEYESHLSDPIILQLGSLSYISITATKQSYEKEDYPIFKMPCRKEIDLTYVKANYTSSNCRLECLANVTLTYYGCVPLLDPKTKDRPCTPNETTHKVLPFFDSTDEYWRKEGQQIKDAFTDCQTGCINPCNGSKTITATSTFGKPLDGASYETQKVYMTQAFNITNTSALRLVKMEDLLKVNIYFPVLQYTHISISEETPIFSFVGNVGGQLGLWTGLCLMSLVQLAYYLIYAGVQCCCRKSNTQTQVIRPSSQKLVYY